MIQIFGVDAKMSLSEFWKKAIDNPSRTKVYVRRVTQDQYISYELDSIHPWRTEELTLQLYRG